MLNVIPLGSIPLVSDDLSYQHIMTRSSRGKGLSDLRLLFYTMVWKSSETKLMVLIRELEVDLDLLRFNLDTPNQKAQAELSYKSIWIPLHDMAVEGQKMSSLITRVSVKTTDLNFDEFKDSEGRQRIYFLINFPMMNHYLLRLPYGYNFFVDPKKGKIIPLNEIQILPLSNPFIGFYPDKHGYMVDWKQNIIGIVANYDEDSFFTFYVFDFPEFDKKIGDTFNYLYQEIKDIFIQKKETLYKEKLLPTGGIFKLNFRPFQSIVVPYHNGPNAQYEHFFVTANSDGDVLAKNFTHWAKISVATRIVASNNVKLKIMGTKK